MGAIFLLIALVGGGLQIGDRLTVPQLSRVRLVALAVTGIMLIGLGVTLNLVADRESQADRPPPAAPHDPEARS
ncbi:hypothetical protein ACSNOI_45045 [Actinomadura kijaniata]|uniref:hypothetical protein n=1 Tax=Actinomadura kijaniata TaxID=46161 RepID=UPI003F1B64B4